MYEYFSKYTYKYRIRKYYKIRIRDKSKVNVMERTLIRNNNLKSKKYTYEFHNRKTI